MQDEDAWETGWGAQEDEPVRGAGPTDDGDIYCGSG